MTGDGAASRFADLDGPVHYLDFGGSGPTLVLVHGLGGSHVNWLAAGPLLAEHARVLAVDLVGFGRTPPSGRSSRVGANQRLLGRFVEEVAGAPVVLAGNSMGGMISVLEAAQHPERVAGLVLVDPSVPRPRGVPLDRMVSAAFTAYALPGVGERFLAPSACPPCSSTGAGTGWSHSGPPATSPGSGPTGPSRCSTASATSRTSRTRTGSPTP